LGDKGIGKSFTADVFKKNFEESHIMQIYSELSPRDILQRRVTDDNGNSIDYYKDKMNIFKSSYPEVYYSYLEHDLRSTYELYNLLLITRIEIHNANIT
jgi:hypothetical protein